MSTTQEPMVTNLGSSAPGASATGAFRCVPSGAALRDGLRLYWSAIGMAVRLAAKGQWKNALRLAMTPIGYWRFVPNGVVARRFAEFGNPAVLDVSSPKALSLMLARRTSSEFYAVDLDDPVIFERWAPCARALGLANYHTEFQDATRLRYADCSFDLVYSISVIEHIPGNGDTAALREMQRVVKPGGTVVVEVPYRRQGRDIYRPYNSRGAPTAEPQFYERHYDMKALETRLLQVPGLQVEEFAVLGEWLPIDPLLSGRRLPRVLRYLVLPVEPWLAAVNYWVRPDDRKGRPLAALIVYRKI